MSLTTNDPALTGRRIAACIGVAGLSVIVPLVIVVVAIASALSGKPFGFGSSELHYYSGTVKNGEMWRVSVPLYRNIIWATKEEFRLSRLNLSTGVDLDTGVVVRGAYCAQTWMNDELYLTTGDSIYKVTGSAPERIAAIPAVSRSLYSPPFVYEDQLTILVNADDNLFQLVHLVDGRWLKGRKVVFPGTGRFWCDDAQRGQTELLPRTSLQPTSTILAGAQQTLTVIQQGQQTHVFIAEYPSFSAYRSGFEFVDIATDEASALAPENSPREATGWIPILAADRRERFYTEQMTCDRIGPLFGTWSRNRLDKYVRWNNGGRLQTLVFTDIQDPDYFGYICADPSKNIAYIVENHHGNWGQVTIRRIEGNVIHLVHLTLPGHATEYLTRWQRLFISLFVAWLTHMAIVASGTAWLTRREPQSMFRFGLQSAKLAPIWRRALAVTIDLSLLLAIASLFMTFFVKWPEWNLHRCCDRLLEYEKMISGVNFPAAAPTLRESLRLSVETFLPKSIGPVTSIVALFLLILYLGTTACLEGRYGLTLGKWLLGVRTRASTLRPCGMARSLTRILACGIDIPCLITPLPAAVSLILWRDGKRIGDRIADTTVIRAGSIRDDDRTSLGQPITLSQPSLSRPVDSMQDSI